MAINTGDYGSFLPLIQNTDISSLYQTSVDSKEFKDLIIRLFHTINQISTVVNTKETGMYLKQEVVNGSVWFGPTNAVTDRLQEHTIAFDFGAIGAGANVLAHGLAITNTWTFTEIRATATNFATGDFYTFPWVGAAGAYVDLHITAANIVINNFSGLTWPKCRVVFKYLKQ